MGIGRKAPFARVARRQRAGAGHQVFHREHIAVHIRGIGQKLRHGDRRRGVFVNSRQRNRPRYDRRVIGAIDGQRHRLRQRVRT